MGARKINNTGFGIIPKLVLGLNIVVAIATLFSYVAPRIDPNTTWYFAMFGLFYPVLLAFNLMFIAYWLFKDLRFVLLSAIIIALGWPFLKSLIVFNSSEISKSPHNISVISYNISNANGAYDRKKDLKATKQERMFEYLKRFDDEDILCLQEVGAYASDILKKGFPNHEIYKIDKGAVILSKHRIINKGQIDFGTMTNSCLWADIVVDLDTFRVYSLHLQSNKISKDAEEIARGNLDNKNTWKGIEGILMKYRYTHITRSSQAKMVKTHIEQSPYPVLVCGDFNDTPVSYTYSELSRGLNDAFIEKGNGMGSTFNGIIPLLRIDYILTDPMFDIKSFHVIRENYSDHFAVASLLQIKK